MYLVTLESIYFSKTPENYLKTLLTSMFMQKLDIKNLKIFTYGNKETIYVKGSAHRINIPVLDKKLSLFLGILWGDGWIVSRKKATTKSQWRIGIVEDDKPLINHFSFLVNEIFSIKVNINDRKTKFEAYFNSRIVYEILNKIFLFPDGEKKNRIHIPKQLNSQNLLTSFLSGLFSTDGKFTLYEKYPRIGLDSASKDFIKEVEKTLIYYQFNPRFYQYTRKNGNKLYTIMLNGVYQTKRFHNIIGFVGEKANKLEKFIVNSPA